MNIPFVNAISFLSDPIGPKEIVLYYSIYFV